MPAFERPPIIGHIDIFEGDRIEGWVIDLDHPHRPALLKVLIDGDVVDSVLCALLREDVKQSGLPSAEAGFLYRIPPLFHDGLRHSLQFQTQRGSVVNFLDNSGQGWEMAQFCLSRQTRVEGMVEGLEAGVVKGWAVRSDLAATGRHGGVLIRVSAEGRPLGQVRADLFRPDVAEALGADPHCGFRFVPPPELRHGHEVMLEFRAIPEASELANSPLAVTFLATDAYASLGRISAEIDRLAGEVWALRGQIRALAATPSYAVEDYAEWAPGYFSALRRRFPLPPGGTPPTGSPATVSVICRLDRPHLLDLMAAIDSVREQTRPDWELLLLDDGQAVPDIAACLATYQEMDGRIRLLPQGGGLAARDIARALQGATGTYVAFLGQEDRLVDVALAVMLQVAEASGAGLLYSDEDRLDPAGRLEAPRLKPDWNPRLLLAQNYLGHLMLVRRQDAVRHWPAKGRNEGAELHEFALRLAESAASGEIRHVPEILYHTGRRVPPPRAADHAAGAVSEHLRRRRLPGEALPAAVPGCLRVAWNFRKEPAVSILLPFHDRVPQLRRCLDALRAHTRYDNLDLVLVDGWSVSAEAEAFGAEVGNRPRTRVVRVREAFNRPRLLNLGAAATTADFLLVLSPAMLAVQPEWLRAMVDEALADPRAGLIGNKLLEPGGVVRAGRVVLGVADGALSAHRGLAGNAPGYMARAIAAQEVAAVSGAATLIRREAFVQSGGFEESTELAPMADLDLSLKVRRAGFRLIWTPDSTLEYAPLSGHDEDAAKLGAIALARQALRARWGEDLGGDPFYHPLFAREGGLFQRLAPIAGAG